MALTSRVRKFTQNLTKNLSLRWRIYLLLTAILLPVFTLTIFVQTRITKPLLQEEVRQLGLSICSSLSTEITAFKLLNVPSQLETKLVQVSWSQPSVVRIEVIAKDASGIKVLATNVTDDPTDDLTIPQGDQPVTSIKKDEGREFWEILFPIFDRKGSTRNDARDQKDRRKVVAYIRSEVSLQLVDQVVGAFAKIAYAGAAFSIGLLILILSYTLRRMIENERKLKFAESRNIELTEQLHETQRQVFLNEKLAVMGQLTASFAHEIGTPLNSISGHLQLMKGEIPAPVAEHRLAVIQSQVTRIEGIVKDFLASTRTPQPPKELVEIESMIDRTINLVAPRAQALKIDISKEVQTGIEPLRAAPTDLEQVLINLTNNALDALATSSAQPKTLKYEARMTPKKNLEIVIRDNGQGIPQTSLKQVLKPFFTTKAPGQGTGLGLTISQGLVKKYGGKLEIDSELGKGTAVKVNISYDRA